MPVYEYDCVDHGVFDEWRAMSESQAAATCRACGRQAPRIVSLPNLRSMVPSDVRARDRNERSQHEPKVLSGAAIGGRRAEGNAEGGSVAHTASPGRPWMMGHG